MNGEDLRELAGEQAALRKVATLVARGAARDEVFAAVTEEVGQLLAVEYAHIVRYEPERAITLVAAWGKAGPVFPLGSRLVLGGRNIPTLVFDTGRPARVDLRADGSGPLAVALLQRGVRLSVGTPIIVEGRLWGVMAVGSIEQCLLPDAEARLATFTELLATAIANAEGRARLARLAEEQAALRRVATLVARGAAPEEVFAAVVEEVGRLLSVDFANMGRYEPEGTLTIVAGWGKAVETFPVGSHWILEGHNLSTIVFETGRPARIDGYADASGPVGVAARDTGFRTAVATPILIEGGLWGVVIAGSTLEQPVPADTEARLAQFTELVATAVANAEGRAALAASRARIVGAADETRRRIERDLHDGTQQQLVSLMLELRAAEAKEPSDVGELRAQLARTVRGLGAVLEELQEISRGMAHPTFVSRGGVERALRVLARRSAVPVELNLSAEQRLPEPVEVAAYYVVSEALTNAAKHAHASLVHVELEAHDALLQLAIRDDGIGGADPARGSGLAGLSDRIDALGGTLQLTSRTGSGTTLLVEIPLDGQSGAASPEP